MAKKTPAEYEAMIGGLMKRIEDLEDKHSNAAHQWEQWQDRAQKAEGVCHRLRGYSELILKIIKGKPWPTPNPELYGPFEQALAEIHAMTQPKG